MVGVNEPIKLETTWLRRFVVGGLLLLALVLITINIRSGTTENVGSTHYAVELLQPLPGSQYPSQARVGVDLAGGWDAQLFINGVAIPLDELDRWDPITQSHVNPLFEIYFSPGVGKVFERFPQGEVCVVAEIFEIVEPGNKTIERWCFDSI